LCRFEKISTDTKEKKVYVSQSDVIVKASSKESTTMEFEEDKIRCAAKVKDRKVCLF